MPYSIRFTPRALRDFSALDRTVQQRLQLHIDRLAENPFPPGAKKLHAEEPYYRIRVGDYRVIYQVEAHQLVIIYLILNPRGDHVSRTGVKCGASCQPLAEPQVAEACQLYQRPPYGTHQIMLDQQMPETVGSLIEV